MSRFFLLCSLHSKEVIAIVLWSCLEIRYYSAIMLPSNKAQWGFLQRGLVCKNDFLGGVLFEGGLILNVYGIENKAWT